VLQRQPKTRSFRRKRSRWQKPPAQALPAPHGPSYSRPNRSPRRRLRRDVQEDGRGGTTIHGSVIDPASMMTRRDRFILVGRGRRMAIVAGGPSPGKTPIAVPTIAPMKAYKRFQGLRAVLNPLIRLLRTSIVPKRTFQEFHPGAKHPTDGRRGDSFQWQE
jgi:hypothetical protein